MLVFCTLPKPSTFKSFDYKSHESDLNMYCYVSHLSCSDLSPYNQKVNLTFFEV